MNARVLAARTDGVIDDEVLPQGWRRDRRLEQADIDRDTSTYIGYVYETDDLRVRIRPPEAGATDAYELVIDSYPGTELADSQEVRTLATADSAADIACSLMKLLDGAYDGPHTVEDAIQYAIERVLPADVPEHELTISD
jgi:hypothetical protein